ncbi:hypothetical protein JXC34_01885 [Candidatus Woesearchaeota archaeon]|nr:hypothetical protein [Candidatus Woesearchaeota archaeon]
MKKVTVLLLLFVILIQAAIAHRGISQIHDWEYDEEPNIVPYQDQACGQVNLSISGIQVVCSNPVGNFIGIPAVKVYDDQTDYFLADNCPLDICEYSALGWDQLDPYHVHAANVDESDRTQGSVLVPLPVGNHTLSFKYLSWLDKVYYDDKSVAHGEPSANNIVYELDLCHAPMENSEEFPHRTDRPYGDLGAFCLKPVDRVLEEYYASIVQPMPSPTVHGIGPLPAEYNEYDIWDNKGYATDENNPKYHGSIWTELQYTVDVEILPEFMGTVYLDDTEYLPGETVTITFEAMSCCGTEAIIKLMDSQGDVVDQATATIQEIGDSVVEYTLPMSIDLSKQYHVEVETNVDSPNCKAQSDISVTPIVVECVSRKYPQDGYYNVEGIIQYEFDNCEIDTWKGESKGYIDITNTLQPGTYEGDGTFLVGLASYKKYDEHIPNQTLYDYDQGYVGPGETIRLEVSVPSCKFQIDSFCGPYIYDFNEGYYNERKIDWAHKNGCYPESGSPDYCEYCGDGYFQPEEEKCDYAIEYYCVDIDCECLARSPGFWKSGPEPQADTCNDGTTALYSQVNDCMPWYDFSSGEELCDYFNTLTGADTDFHLIASCLDLASGFITGEDYTKISVDDSCQPSEERYIKISDAIELIEYCEYINQEAAKDVAEGIYMDHHEGEECEACSQPEFPKEDCEVPGYHEDCRDDSYEEDACTYCGDGVWQEELEECDYACTLETCTDGGYNETCTEDCTIAPQPSFTKIFCVGLTVSGGQCIETSFGVGVCDFNKDGMADVIDLTILEGKMGSEDQVDLAIYDINSDRVIDESDYELCVNYEIETED